MNRHWLIAALLAILALPAAAAPAAAPFEQVAYGKLIAAIEAQSLSDFTELGDDAFKATPPAQFAKAAAKFSPLLKAGHQQTYLGDFKGGGVRLYYWKLQFTGDPEDWLVKLAVQDGKVRGFFINRP